jgi:hypothetical protein
MASSVTSGIFFGMTRQQLDRVRENLQAKLSDNGFDRASGVTINGQTMTFMERGGMTMDRAMSELQNAYHQIDPFAYPNRVLDRTSAGFNYGAQFGAPFSP